MEPRARAGKNVGKMNFGFGELRQILYGSGDAREPLPETMRLLDEIATDFIQSLAFEAARIGHYAGRQKIKYEDFEFALRRNPLFLGKVREMFEMSKEVKDARKMPGIGEGNLAKADVGELARLGGIEDDDAAAEAGTAASAKKHGRGADDDGSDVKKTKKKKAKLGGSGGAAAAAAAAKTKAPILSTATAATTTEGVEAGAATSPDGPSATADGAMDELFADGDGDDDIFGDATDLVGFGDVDGAAAESHDPGTDGPGDDGPGDDGPGDDGPGDDGPGDDDDALEDAFGDALDDGLGLDDDDGYDDETGAATGTAQGDGDEEDALIGADTLTG